MRFPKNAVFRGIVALFALSAATAFAADGTLRVNKMTFSPGEQISVSFTAPASYDAHAWVGIIPSDIPHGKEAVNDAHDITYQYLNKRSRGTLTFAAPGKPGNYDLRMNDTDSDGREVTSVSFTVEGVADAGATGKPTLKANKQSFAPGETITVTFTAPGGYDSSAWVGIIPAEIAHGDENVNDANDVSYQYLNKRTKGTLTFKAPDRRGKWDLRMSDSDNGGKEVASAGFTVR